MSSFDNKAAQIDLVYQKEFEGAALVGKQGGIKIKTEIDTGGPMAWLYVLQRPQYNGPLVKMYLSQIEKFICLKLQNVFVSNCQIYLCHIVKCICLKLHNEFVSNCKIYLS